ncbi:MAG: proline--tRNA ligase [Candidatus Lactobacillus pullistercoris]|uniref:Proline--tRNA ligase n=1 Tax=Candidatus Lactobacillus pullistercoris TaxID=2838636 RepID=A0A9E2KRP6_9LACO|nr:proline--tRNA ligase [Candidatus Lactobacillus pullistercoris]
MRQSKFFMPTLKEAPADAVAESHKLMLRGGYIRQVTAGVYAYLPLGYRVLRKAEAIIEEEMENINVPEMIMPHLLPATLWQESGRYKKYGAEMFKLKDRHGRESLLGPTHEETFTEIIAKNLKSYKQMPMALYQIQTKFRDENRPRFGLLRGREFVMLDGYSFAATRDQLDQQFDDQKNAYKRIFKRAGVTVHPVIADSGTMGGKNSTEFQAPAAIGEDTIATNESGTYAANLEMAKSIDTFKQEAEDAKELTKVSTPDCDTIDKLAKFLNVPATRIVKSILYIADDQKVLVLIRGDKQINEVKLGHVLDADEVREANTSELKEITGSEKGGVGPINADWADKIVADETVKGLYNVVVGANETDYQFENANLDRDFKVDEFADLRIANEGEPDPVDHEPLKFTTSIEVGHIFKLGTYYTKTMGADFLDNNGKAKPVIMGSYGIGVTRMLSAIVEQHLTKNNAIAWPKEVAPFKVHIIQMKMNNDEQTELAEKFEKELSAKYDVLYDDRKERPGVKFNDADLVGAPVRITIGRKAADGIVEVKRPTDEKATEISVDELDGFLTKELG